MKGLYKSNSFTEYQLQSLEKAVLQTSTIKCAMKVISFLLLHNELTQI